MTTTEPLIKSGYTTLESIVERETLNQVSILQSLSQGDFLGSITVAELKTLGDTGLGTFDKLDGELIMLNGQVYKAKSDGSVLLADDEETVPFADVTFMDNDITFDLPKVDCLMDLFDLLTKKVEFANPNLFYVTVIPCNLAWVKVRSATLRYQDEYTTLAQHMKHAERTFDYENVTGTLVGLYCPPFTSSINMPGWHLHLLSEDCTKGGHILNLKLESGVCHMDQTRCFNMILPDADNRFADMDLTVDQAADLKKVESSD